jgi:hypothetical protein
MATQHRSIGLRCQPWFFAREDGSNVEIVGFLVLAPREACLHARRVGSFPRTAWGKQVTVYTDSSLSMRTSTGRR